MDPGSGIIKSATSRYCQAAALRGPGRVLVGGFRAAVVEKERARLRQLRQRREGRPGSASLIAAEPAAPSRRVGTNGPRGLTGGEVSGRARGWRAAGGSRSGLTCCGRSLQEPLRPGLTCRKRVRSS